MMIPIRGLILCEGESDQVLLGAYLAKQLNLTFKKRLKTNHFEEEPISWYMDENNRLIGIWNVGGTNFVAAVQKIMHLELIDHLIEAIIVVTDFDDDNAKKKRPSEIYDAIHNAINIKDYNMEEMLAGINAWHLIKFDGSFSQMNTIKYCYLLVPMDSQGALETFMLNALSENDESRKEVIIQARKFIKDFKSEKYLRKRRERIKAELGISVSVFNPERMFDTMIELINHVDWTKFEQTERQFGILKDI